MSERQGSDAESLPIALVPVGLRVEGRDVLVVGAGPVAARKAAAFVEQGAVVTVVAPFHSPPMDAVAVDSRWYRRYRPSDLDGVWLVVTATGDPGIDGQVFADAEARRIWCNAADDPAHCSVVLPAVVRRDSVTVSVATGGRSPAVASWLRRRVEALLADLLDDATLAVCASAARVRQQVRAEGLSTEVTGWADVLDGEALDLAREGRIDDLDRRLLDAVLPAARRRAVAS